MDIDLVSTEKKGWRFDISDMEFRRQPTAHSGDFFFIFYCICKKWSQIMQIKAKNIPRYLIAYHYHYLQKA